MKHFLLDTHVLLWSLTSPSKLRPQTRKLLTNADGNLWLSPISAWELALLVERERVTLRKSVRDFLRDASETIGLGEAALNHEVALRSREILRPHGDPADRFLAATASVYDLTLLTADKKLLAGKGFEVRAA